jgi:hypothetical protein
MTFLLFPPIAFLLYMVLVGILSLTGRSQSASSPATEFKSTTYSSGEANPNVHTAPGYRQFFIIGLFFAVLHLGILMIGSGGLTLVAGIYIVGLILVLLALILG